jgi:hypothetical protein
MARKRCAGKGNSEAVIRTAEQPRQALNVDLWFIPEHHTAEEKLPAVSGCSGHLVVKRIHLVNEERHWSGQIFAEGELNFAEAMQQYAQTTQDRVKVRASLFVRWIPAFQR